MPKFTVTDTITFSRVWRNVEAVDGDAAIDIIADNAEAVPCQEEQIDNTVYEAEVQTNGVK